MNYSIAITTFNDAKEIKHLLDNISMFERKPDEIIIADGGSTDNTIEIIQNYKTNIRINIIRKGRLNISQGLNCAISECRSDAFLICSTGNSYEKKYSLKCIEAIESGADISYGKLKGNSNNWFQKQYCKAFLDGKNGIIPEIASNHGTMMKTILFRLYGGFLEDFIRAGEDTEYYKYLKKQQVKIVTINSSYVTWDVPRNINEFYTQIKWYTIASMQLDNNVSIMKIMHKKLLRFLCIFIGILVISLIDFRITLLTILFLAITVMYNFSLLRILLRDYIVIKYRKYMNAQYKVTRSKV